MTDTVLTLAGSQGYEVSTLPDYTPVGTIDSARFTITPKPGSILQGIAAGPHASKQAAMDAIAKHTKGECRMFNPR